MVMAMVMRRVAGRRISAGEFKAKCLRLMDQVEATGERIVITKRGKPVAELGPVRGQSGSLLGSLRGRVEVLGDIVAPIDGVSWKAMH
jgi:prevent-host-death family protein